MGCALVVYAACRSGSVTDAGFATPAAGMPHGPVDTAAAMPVHWEWGKDMVPGAPFGRSHVELEVQQATHVERRSQWWLRGHWSGDGTAS